MRQLLVALSLVFCFSLPLQAVEVPKKDKIRIETSIRQSLSVLPTWNINLTDVKPASLKGLYEGTIEFSNNGQVRKQNILLSKDYRKYIIGNIFDATEDSDKSRLDKINLKNAPFLGPESAKVTVVEYSDLQCPSCKKAHELFKADKILESFPTQVRLVFKNHPLTNSHKWAMPAAVAAMCAHKQNPKAFWSMADNIFVNQSSITVSNLWDHLSTYAASAELDMKSFKKCYDTQETISSVEADLAEAEVLGVNQTPTFFINGRVVLGYPGKDNLHQLIREFIDKK